MTAPVRDAMRLLLMFDDDGARRHLDDQLRRERFNVDIAPRGGIGQTASEARTCDVIVLDNLFQGRDAVSVCRDLRARGVSTPIVMLAAWNSPEYRAAALTAGADDCLTTPVAFSEFLARIRAVSRRAGTNRPAVLKVADLTLDPLRHQVTRGRSFITLTRMEYAILGVLMGRAGELVTRSALHKGLWGARARPAPNSNRLDVHISNLRRKLARAGGSPLIETVRGCGYRMDDGRREVEHDAAPGPASAVTVISDGEQAVEMR